MDSLPPPLLCTDRPLSLSPPPSAGPLRGLAPGTPGCGAVSRCPPRQCPPSSVSGHSSEPLVADPASRPCWCVPSPAWDQQNPFKRAPCGLGWGTQGCSLDLSRRVGDGAGGEEEVPMSPYFLAAFSGVCSAGWALPFMYGGSPKLWVLHSTVGVLRAPPPCPWGSIARQMAGLRCQVPEPQHHRAPGSRGRPPSDSREARLKARRRPQRVEVDKSQGRPPHAAICPAASPGPAAPHCLGGGPQITVTHQSPGLQFYTRGA